MYSSPRGSGNSSPGQLLVYLLLVALIGIAVIRCAQLSGGGFSYSTGQATTATQAVKETVSAKTDQDRLVPLYYQFDDRWADQEYCNDTIKKMGCGPACLSMCAIGLTGKTEYDIPYVVKMSKKYGYYVDDTGSRWTLISEGASRLGLKATELTLSKKKVVNSIEAGHPVILVVGPGPFTSNGHFVVITGYKDGKFIINDPNSKENSQKTWKWDDFEDCIRNLWSISKK